MSIKFITIHDASDLKIVIDSPIFISCDSKSQNEEILINMWALSFDPKIVEIISVNDLVDLVSSLVKKRTQQVLELGISCPVVFYMWFDEMAAQLRFNIISDFNTKLPFGCEVNVVSSPESILEEFLASHYHAGISWSELEESENDLDDDNEKHFVLKVFVMGINSRG